MSWWEPTLSGVVAAVGAVSAVIVDRWRAERSEARRETSLSYAAMVAASERVANEAWLIRDHMAGKAPNLDVVASMAVIRDRIESVVQAHGQVGASTPCQGPGR